MPRKSKSRSEIRAIQNRIIIKGSLHLERRSSPDRAVLTSWALQFADIWVCNKCSTKEASQRISAMCLFSSPSINTISTSCRRDSMKRKTLCLYAHSISRLQITLAPPIREWDKTLSYNHTIIHRARSRCLRSKERRVKRIRSINSFSASMARASSSSRSTQWRSSSFGRTEFKREWSSARSGTTTNLCRWSERVPQGKCSSLKAQMLNARETMRSELPLKYWTKREYLAPLMASLTRYKRSKCTGLSKSATEYCGYLNFTKTRTSSI